MLSSLAMQEPAVKKGLNPLGGLRRANFEKIAPNGFGEPLNAYPHSMIWFRDHLYVGTTRANAHLIAFSMQENIERFVWPVERPNSPFDLDL